MPRPLPLVTALLVAITLPAAEGGKGKGKGKDNDEVAATLPDQPVAASSLAAEQLAAFRRAAELRVTPSLLTDAIGPMSFTSGTKHDLNQLNTHVGFEPMAWRPLVRPVRDSAPGDDRIHVSDGFGQEYPAGHFDGARVRVYQVVDGRMTLIRDGHVPTGGHRTGGWRTLAGGFAQAGPGATTWTVPFTKNARLGVPYWFTVRAVYDGKDLGPPAAAVQVTPTAVGKPSKAEPHIKEWNKGLTAATPGLPKPTAPGNLRVQLVDGAAVLTWDAVPPEGLVGYKVFYAQSDPAAFGEPTLRVDVRTPCPERHVQAGDLVFLDQYTTTAKKANEVDHFAWNKPDFWPNCGLGGFTCWPDEDPKRTWAMVPHPQPLPPEFVSPGETCLMLRNDGGEPMGVELLKTGGSDQSHYRILRPVRHTITAWVRGSGSLRVQFAGPYGPDKAVFPYPTFSGMPAGEFPIAPLPVPLTDAWRKVSLDFTPPGVPKAGHGAIYLTYDGPGTCHVDNVVLYESDQPASDYHPITLQALRDSGMSLMRTHELIKTKEGYSLASMTNLAGGLNYTGTGYRSHTFHSLLRQMQLAGTVSPWLQVEMCLSDEEWLGFVEWLAAPYDPATDTPQSKPWAWKRHSLGQTRPWLDAFPRFAFEISNETWNSLFRPYYFGREMTDSVTGRVYSGGETYGLFNEHVIAQLRKSPYWTKEIEAKTTFMLCGWGTSRYGTLARAMSPSADVITSAGYCHNDGLGDPGTFTDFKLFYQLQWGLSAVEPSIVKSVQNVKDFRRHGQPTDWGVYEFGPAYHVMPGDPAAAKQVDQRLARNMTAAVYVLDAVLRRARSGDVDQAFFTFEHQTGPWGTHTTLLNGGHGYPKWKAMTLFNRFGTGRFLDARFASVPTWDFPAYEAQDNMAKAKRAALPQAPLVSGYAMQQGDRVSVFLLSRKLDNFPVSGDDGFTPVSVVLPFTQAAKATLYKLVGDPRVDDRLAEHVVEQAQPIATSLPGGTLTVNATTGADARGLPPASIFVYVFEGVTVPGLAARPEALIAPIPHALVGAAFTAANRPRQAAPAGTTYQWSLEGVGTATGPTATFTLPTVGAYPLALDVADRHGAGDHDALTIQGCIADRSGRLWTSGGTTAKNPVTATIDGDAFRIRSTSATLGGLQAIAKGFVMTATLAELAGPNAKAVASAGLGAGAQSAWSDDWRPDSEPGVRILQDGSVQVGKISLLPKGSVRLPATLRLTVQDGQAVYAIQEGGAWRDLHTVADVRGCCYPLLTMSSGSPREPGTCMFQDVRITPLP